MTTRFVVCGETLIDLIQADDQPEGFVSSAWSAMSAGGPMNSAVALGDLGADVHFLGRLSRDAFGAQLRGHIEGAGVALDLATESSQATSLAVVSLDDERQGELHLPLQRHRELRLGGGGPADPLRRRLAAHRLARLRGQPGQ